MICFSKIVVKLFTVISSILIIMIVHASADTIDRQGIKDTLKDTAHKYWNLRMQQDYEATYKMEDKEGLPSFKDYVPRVQAIKKFNIKSHSIKDIVVDDKGISGIVTIEFKILMPAISKPFIQLLDDKWVYKDEKWIHILPQ